MKARVCIFTLSELQRSQDKERAGDIIHAEWPLALLRLKTAPPWHVSSVMVDRNSGFWLECAAAEHLLQNECHN